jgi:hypothetical protein
MSPLLTTPVPVGAQPPPGQRGIFAGSPVLIVHSPVQAHDTKKRSGSSDGAMTHDTPIT